MKKVTLAKQFLSAILTLAMLLGILATLPITVGAASGVTATAENPILIGSLSDLNSLSATVGAATPDEDGVYYIEIASDIDCGGATIEGQSLVNYTVHINGNGHTVSNYAAKYGIFYNAGDNSTIENLHATGAKVSGNAKQAAAILGYARDGFTMTNCSASGTVTTTSTNSLCAVGGLVGAIEQGDATTTVIFEDCVSNVTLTAPTQASAGVGGIVGRVSSKFSNLVLHGCTNNAPISGGYYAGGMVGYIEYARELTIEECVNNGAISTTGSAAGGMLGYGNAYGNQDNWFMTRCINVGNVSATTNVGGIIGRTEGNTRLYYMNCGNEGTVTGSATNATVGGFHGYGHVPKALSLTLLFNYGYNSGKLVVNGAGTSGGAIGYFNAVSGNSITVQGHCEKGEREFIGTASGRHALLTGKIDGCSAALSLKSSHLPTSSSLPHHNETSVKSDTIAGTYDSYLDGRQRSAKNRIPDGNGSKTDPYVIKTEWELNWFAGKPETFDDVVYAELAADIDFGGKALNITLWNKTRSQEYDGDYTARQLHFDGKGHTISNYTSTAGLFQYIGAGSVIQNLNVSNATVSLTKTSTTMSSSTYFHAGTIVGTAGGNLTMLNCSATSSTVTTKSLSYAAGGLIGGIGDVDGLEDVMSGVSLIINCHNNGVTVKTSGSSAVGAVGGVIGTICATEAVTISDCSNAAKVSTSAGTTGVGGIVGSISSASKGISLNNCINTGTVGSSTERAAAGGIVGYTAAATTIRSSRNEGGVSASSYAGGIVGRATASVTVKTSANAGTVSATTNAGAMLGTSTGSVTIDTSYNEGTATDGLTAMTATITNSYNGAANRIAATKALADARLNTTTTNQKLSVRIKLTDDFGLMGITYLDAITGSSVGTIGDYDEVGFYFLQTEDTVSTDEVVSSGKRIAGSSYGGSTTRFAAAYAGIHPTALGDDLHLVAYARRGEVELLSTVRTVDIKALVTDLSDDGALGDRQITTNATEISLYGSMLRYGAAYERYATRELKLGTLNLMQDHFDRTDADYKNPSDANSSASLEDYADAMLSLDLDVLGLNEVNMYRKNYGGYNVPWEIARRMEAETGDKYYWAFASATDRAQTPYNRYQNATGTAGVDYPDGHYYSGDGGDARSFNKVCYGEGIVSKYPILNCYTKDIYADHIGQAWRERADMVDGEGQTLERRVILVVQLDIDGVNDGKGDIITVMVGHFSSSYVEPAMQASVDAVADLLSNPQYQNTPVFFVGDLNMPIDRTYIEQIDKLLNRAGNDNMSPTFRGGSQIDYVYTSDEIEVLSYDVASRRHVVSDHYPVYVTARIPRKQYS